MTRFHSILCAAALVLAAGMLVSCKYKKKAEPAAEAEEVPESAAPGMMPAKTLVVIDVQRDFFDPSGSLYVPGSEVLPEKIAAIAPEYDAVVLTLDWHPGNHCSFKEQGGMWPVHCVAFTQGAGLPDCFAPILANTEKVRLLRKGQDASREQYGAFETKEEIDPAILAWFASSEQVDVCGIAGDYCVKESTGHLLNYVDAGRVTMLTDCIRSIDDGSALNAFIKEKGLKVK